MSVSFFLFVPSIPPCQPQGTKLLRMLARDCPVKSVDDPENTPATVAARVNPQSVRVLLPCYVVGRLIIAPFARCIRPAGARRMANGMSSRVCRLLWWSIVSNLAARWSNPAYRSQTAGSFWLPKRLGWALGSTAHFRPPVALLAVPCCVLKRQAAAVQRDDRVARIGRNTTAACWEELPGRSMAWYCCR